MISQKDRCRDPDKNSNKCKEGIAPTETEPAVSSFINQ